MPASNLGPGAPMSFPSKRRCPVKARPHKVSKTKQRPWGTPEQEKQTKNPWEKSCPPGSRPFEAEGIKAQRLAPGGTGARTLDQLWGLCRLRGLLRLHCM